MKVVRMTEAGLGSTCCELGIAQDLFNVSVSLVRHDIGPARSTGRRTAWPPRGPFVAPPPCDVGRSQVYRAGYATLPSVAQRRPCRSRTGRAVLHRSLGVKVVARDDERAAVLEPAGCPSVVSSAA